MVDAGAHPVDRPLERCRVLVTRERPGELARLLADAGASLMHVPLIQVVDPAARDQAELISAVAAGPDWVVVTSAAGAERVAPLLLTAGASIRVGAVGTATARAVEEQTGRAPDLVPARQLGAELARELTAMCPEPQSIVVAQADAAHPALVDGLVAAGHSVRAVTAYRTESRRPDTDEMLRMVDVDAVAFASGSAARSWAEALGDEAEARLPAIVAVIGPTTASATWNAGLKVTDIAADHSMSGLVEAVARAWRVHRQ